MGFLRDIKEYLELGITAIITLYVVFRLIPTWENRLQSFQKESVEAVHVLQLAVQQVSNTVTNLAQTQVQLVAAQSSAATEFGRHEQRSIAITQMVEKIDETTQRIRADMARGQQTADIIREVAALVTEVEVISVKIDNALRAAIIQHAVDATIGKAEAR